MDHHCHDHSHDHGDHDHDHDHDHPESTDPQGNLYSYIDHAHIAVLNVNDDNAPNKIIKPWHDRLNEEAYVESDVDDQILVRIPFTGSVKLQTILLKSGPGDQTPQSMRVFTNQDNLDFSDIADQPPIQEFEVPQAREVGSYHVRASKFPNVSSVTLFFPASQGSETLRIYYLGFIGTWTRLNHQPIITTYEAQANLADHEKIQGIDGALSKIQ